MREMMLLGSNSMVSSCARCDVTRNDTRAGGNTLSGESQHLRRGKTYKGSRNRPHLSLQYADVAHVDNHWSNMPPLADQHTRMVTFTAPLAVQKLLTPMKMSYEAAMKRAEPYTKIVEELPKMRGEAVQVVRQAVRGSLAQAARRCTSPHHA